MDYDEFFICKRKGCINPRVTKRHCRDCANELNAKSAQKRKERKLKGICAKCGCKRYKSTAFCLYHYMKNIAKNTAGDESLGPILYKKFLDQGKRCYYTGIYIKLGVNASLDHIYPQNRFFEYRSDPRNLVWTFRHLNSMKSDLDLKDFLIYCELVAKNADRIRRTHHV